MYNEYIIFQMNATTSKKKLYCNLMVQVRDRNIHKRIQLDTKLFSKIAM